MVRLQNEAPEGDDAFDRVPLEDWYPTRTEGAAARQLLQQLCRLGTPQTVVDVHGYALPTSFLVAGVLVEWLPGSSEYRFAEIIAFPLPQDTEAFLEQLKLAVSFCAERLVPDAQEIIDRYGGVMCIELATAHEVRQRNQDRITAFRDQYEMLLRLWLSRN